MADYSVLTTLDDIWSIAKIVIDVAIVFLAILYLFDQFKKNSRTVQLLKGIVVIVAFNAIAKLLDLQAVTYITDLFINWGFLALIVIFQPEIRSMLEKIGTSSANVSTSTLLANEKEQLVQDIYDATVALSKNRIGALITIEQSTSLEDYTGNAVEINAKVSPNLLTSLFQTTTSLHDGAVIIKGNRITYASVYFPSAPQQISNRYGARHRAALSISQVSDSLTIVVSEETSGISIAYNGKINSVDETTLKNKLRQIILGVETDVDNDSTYNSSIIIKGKNDRKSFVSRFMGNEDNTSKTIHKEFKMPVNNRDKYYENNLNKEEDKEEPVIQITDNTSKGDDDGK